MTERRHLGRLSRAALWLLERSAPARDRSAMIGDLVEELEELHVRGHGSAKAALGLWSEALRSLLPNLLRSSRTPRRQEEPMLSQIAQDLRFALREHGRRPLVGLLVVLTLGLGIAANTVIFSAVDTLLLDPFPYPEPKTLIGVGPVYPRLESELAFWEVLSPAEIEDIRSQSRTLEKVVSWDMGHRTIAGEDAPENVFTAFWWGDAFSTLGVVPAVGRGFTEQETRERSAVAVLGHGLWQRKFGGRSDVVGDTLLVNGDPYEIVGVMPEGTSIYGTELWIPMGIGPEVFDRERRQFQLLARIRDGHTMDDVELELDTIARRIEQEYATTHDEYEDFSLVPATWNEINVSRLQPLALALVGAVLFVLVLVCVNIANLLLGRSLRREQEMAVRRTLGAGTGRLVQQLLTESVLLAGLGGLLGVALAWFGARGLSSLLGSLGLPLPTENIQLHGRVLAVSAVLSLLAGLAFGLAPAVQAARRALGRDLGSSRAGVSAPVSRQRLQRVFVAAQVALALVLVHGGLLFVAGFLQLQSDEPGLRVADTTTLRITLPWERYDGPRIQDFFSSLQERLEALPEVERAASISQLPPSVFSRAQLVIEDREPPSEDALPWAYLTAASPGAFETLGIPLLEGRDFTPLDDSDAPRVTVVSRLFAERYLAEGSPLGQRIRVAQSSEGEGPIWYEVIGVVDSVHNRGMTRPPQPEIYASVSQGHGANQLFVALHSPVDARVLAERVRQEVRALDPSLAIYAIQSLDDAFGREAAPVRYSATLLAMLGGFALLLAGVGVYSVMSVAAASRTREIGLRMALGATARRVRHWLVRVCAWPVLLGAGLGLLAAFGLGRALSGLLPGLGGGAGLTALLFSTALLTSIAAVAAIVPTVRASRLDPVQTLQGD